MDHILVPLDGTPSSESVLPTLRRLIQLGASRVTLLRAELPAGIEQYSMLSDTVLQHARGYLEEVRRRLSGTDASVRTLTMIGAPADAVLETARSEKASLILMGADKPPALARILFGSVAERVVQRSPVPVLALPTDRPPDLRPVQQFLVPLDGEDASMAILPHALEAARKLGSRLLLLRVIPRDCVDSEVFELAEEQLYAAAERCAGAGVGFSVLIERGDVVERILAAARDREADAIAMATRGRAHWIRPSVTRRVLRATGLPLLSVRAESIPAAAPERSLTAR